MVGVFSVVFFSRASQSVMAARSYVKPSTAITGSSISSCEEEIDNSDDTNMAREQQNIYTEA